MSDRDGVPLAEQIIEVEKTIRDRGRRYQFMIDKGRLKPETAERKIATMRAVQSTLIWLERNQKWIRSVAAVQQVFPGAEVKVAQDDEQPTEKEIV